MSYHDVFLLFKSQVKLSIEQNEFAKLTMAKTIGKPELKNIFLRPVAFKTEHKVLLKLRYASREVEDYEETYNLKDAFDVIEKHLRNPFLSVILFTKTKDVMFKINKKGAGSITETPPTFQNIIIS
jgi:hypothetical protein